MAKVISVSSASAHPREQSFRSDFNLLMIKLDGNVMPNKDIMRAKAGNPGELDLYRYDMSGKPMMITKSLPDTEKVTGNVSIVGPKAPCEFCMGMRKHLKAWMNRWLN